ncbi:S-adenosylmethionine decarboxylase family protein [Acidovorax facilis]|uniref:S-adenosylmethionine decarboxylase family protein n=1 Tax=Acidovorax facilis TaxID=12917 RepID=UPI003D651B65
MPHFGEHLTFDGYGGDPELLGSESIVRDAIVTLVEALGMTVLGGPEVYFASPTGMKDSGGWTGFVVLQESHISIHTFSAQGFVSADVYTCKNGIDADLLRHILSSSFGTTTHDVTVLKRGLRFPGTQNGW